MKQLEYTVILEPDDDGMGYTVTVPALPGCISEGDTMEEALENVQDALWGCLAAARELNLPIPETLRSVAERADKLLRSQ